MAFCTNCGAQMEGAFCGQCGARAAAEPSQPPATPAGTPQAAPASPKGKNKLLIWGLVGCGGLFVLVLIASMVLGFFVSRKTSEFGKNPGFAAARMMASMNPNVEVVDADEGTGKITLRDKKTGKTVTLDFREIQKGRISFEGEDGEKVDIQTEGEGGNGSMTVKTKDGTAQFGAGSLADIPGWIPKYPGAEAVGTFSSQSKGKEGGAFQLKCSGSVQEVADYYEQALKGAGMTVERQSMPGGSGFVVLKGTHTGQNREVTVTVMTSDGSTVANIVYGLE